MADNKLYIGDGKNNVAIAELGVVLGKQQVILGDFERDLILRTAGSIKVQVGNSLYDLPITKTSTSNSSVTVTNSLVTTIASESSLNTLTYPGDGNFVYVLSDKAFYICESSKYILLCKGGVTNTTTPTTAKVYLSFDESQSLNSTEKLQLALNTGAYVNSLDDITLYTSNDVFAGQLIYSISDGKHYRLIDINNPTLKESWQEIYVSLSTGGNVLSNITISPDKTTGQTNTALHISGSYTQNQIGSPTEVSSIFSIGNKDLSSGLAIWSNDGSIKFQSLAQNSLKGFTFLTQDDAGALYSPLLINKNNVGIGGTIDYNYNHTITGSLALKSNVYLTNALQSPDFLSGQNGTGFALYRDTSNVWSLEVDKILVRQDLSGTSYQVDGVNGALVANFTITVQEADPVESFGVYVNASSSGKYSDTSGTIRPISNRQMYVNVYHSTVATLDNDPRTEAYELVSLAYGVGDRDSLGNVDTVLTYNKDVNGVYYTPTGNYSYDSATNSFVSNSSGNLVLLSTVNVYYVQSTGQPHIEVGDLLYFKSWSDDKLFLSAIHAEVVNVASTGYYVYVYEGGNLAKGTTLVKIGNRNGTKPFLQLNSADLSNPFMELLTNHTSFSDFYENYWYEGPNDFQDVDDLREDAWSSQLHTRLRVGSLDNIRDTDLQLSTTQYGLYSDNAYLKGNFVLNSAVFNNISTTSTVYPFLSLYNGKMQTIDLASNVTNWNTAYSWGDHHGLYKLISYVPDWSEITNKPTFATVATSGLYSDLTGRPTLATVATSGSYADLINRPALATVATSGSYTDLTNLPAAPNLQSVTNSGNTTTTSITASAFYQSSLRELKEHIEPYSDDALSLLNSLQVKSFYFKGSKEFNVGFIVDEVQEVNMDILNYHGTAISTNNLVAQLTKAVQQLSKRVEDLEWELGQR